MDEALHLCCCGDHVDWSSGQIESNSFRGYDTFLYHFRNRPSDIVVIYSPEGKYNVCMDEDDEYKISPKQQQCQF